MGTWINDDGLVVRFGIEEAVQRNIGAYQSHGPRRFVEVIAQAGELPLAADSSTILNDQFAIPEGAYIEDVEIVTTTTFVGADATFDLGVINQDRSTGGDPDGFVEAATLAELNAGGTNVAGWVGDLVGTTLDAAKLLVWNVSTANLTAGAATIRIHWSVPPKSVDTLAWDKS